METRKEKIVNVALMLEHKGGTFTNEFNEPTVSKKEWDEIMDAMSS
ncbi:MAG: hypothetical protein LBD75_08265 [Candidatus Peribacteria bacterium]|nr:hypothetical protein [Candidatus Peribacteria bacterium]